MNFAGASESGRRHFDGFGGADAGICEYAADRLSKTARAVLRDGRQIGRAAIPGVGPA